MLFDLAEIRILDFLNIILRNLLTDWHASHTLEPGMWRINLHTKILLFREKNLSVMAALEGEKSWNIQDTDFEKCSDWG
jgi:hypothetical protein